MKVYLTGAFEYMDRGVGFGNAAWHIYRSLRKLGVDAYPKKLNNNSRQEADIEICFNHPSEFKFYTDGYKIGYIPWECSDLPQSWPAKIALCDEVWATSHWSREAIFEKNLPDKKVFTYQHGIDHIFKSEKKREPKKPFTFLYIGEPQLRKDGPLVARTFLELYANNPDYKLIIKGSHSSTITVPDSGGAVFGPPNAFYNNVEVILDMLSMEDMLKLYDRADVFVYPTWGEGFGFNPLQAMAMGIPTITTYKWADYREYITVPIDSDSVLSPWPEIHPGRMFKPNARELKAAMKAAPEKYSKWSQIAFKNAYKIHEEYDWVKVTKPTVEHLGKIFETLQLETVSC